MLNLSSIDLILYNDSVTMFLMCLLRNYTRIGLGEETSSLPKTKYSAGTSTKHA